MNTRFKHFTNLLHKDKQRSSEVLGTKILQQ